MAFKDRDMISKDDHELNYVLKKYKKRQTKFNRSTLLDILSSFRSDETYKPHFRADFYKYISDKNSFSSMEVKK